uniref:Uncharacterized protein n=1 Tax=Mustela putorius furo TaxID=9669 RepID=M3XUN1_MUSPF
GKCATPEHPWAQFLFFSGYECRGPSPQVPPALLAPGAAGSAARSPPSRRRRSERRSWARAGRLWPGGACSGLAQLARHPSPPGSWRPPIAVCSPRPCHGECAICGEALPQLPAASPGASLDRGFSGWGARPCAGNIPVIWTP